MYFLIFNLGKVTNLIQIIKLKIKKLSTLNHQKCS